MSEPGEGFSFPKPTWGMKRWQRLRVTYQVVTVRTKGSVNFISDLTFSLSLPVSLAFAVLSLTRRLCLYLSVSPLWRLWKLKWKSTALWGAWVRHSKRALHASVCARVLVWSAPVDVLQCSVKLGFWATLWPLSWSASSISLSLSLAAFFSYPSFPLSQISEISQLTRPRTRTHGSLKFTCVQCVSAVIHKTRLPRLKWAALTFTHGT